jgi:hypothetical protein
MMIPRHVISTYLTKSATKAESNPIEGPNMLGHNGLLLCSCLPLNSVLNDPVYRFFSQTLACCCLASQTHQVCQPVCSTLWSKRQWHVAFDKWQAFTLWCAGNVKLRLSAGGVGWAQVKPSQHGCCTSGHRPLPYHRGLP